MLEEELLGVEHGPADVFESESSVLAAGDVLFAVDQNGDLSTLGWDSLDSSTLPSISLGSAAFHDSSVYIGDARFSWDRAARTMHLDRLKNTGIPAYLVAAGFTPNDMPASHPNYTDLGAHGWLGRVRVDVGRADEHAVLQPAALND